MKICFAAWYNALERTVGLATIDIVFEGMSSGCATAQNRSVSEAIIGLDSLLTHAAEALYGSIVDPEVDVRRTAEPGRYEVDLGFRSNIGMARRASLSDVPMYTDPQPAVVMRALGLFPHDLAAQGEEPAERNCIEGALPLLLALAGREVSQVFFVGESVDIRAGLLGLFHVPRSTYQLFCNREVRAGFAALGKALADPAVGRVLILDRASGAVIAELTAAEIGHLQMPPESDVKLTDAVATVALQLADPVFRCDAGWLFTDGFQRVCAKMRDVRFLTLVDNGVVSLAPGMIMIARMRVQSTQTAGGLVTDCSIVKVLDVRDARVHLPMPGLP